MRLAHKLCYFRIQESLRLLKIKIQQRQQTACCSSAATADSVLPFQRTLGQDFPTTGHEMLQKRINAEFRHITRSTLVIVSQIDGEQSSQGCITLVSNRKESMFEAFGVRVIASDDVSSISRILSLFSNFVFWCVSLLQKCLHGLQPWYLVQLNFLRSRPWFH